jgi:hypothetical protein
MDAVKKMGLEELNTVINTSKGLTAVMKQAITTRIKSLSTPEVPSPVESVQESIAAESVTTDAPATDAPEVPAPVEAITAKVEKNKPGETTRTIEKFTDDTKGIRAGSMVTFLEKGTNKVLTGQVQRVFDFYGKRDNRQEVKIMVGTKPNQTRHYRFEKDITPVVAIVVPEVVAPEVEEVAAEVIESAPLA